MTDAPCPAGVHGAGWPRRQPAGRRPRWPIDRPGGAPGRRRRPRLQRDGLRSTITPRGRGHDPHLHARRRDALRRPSDHRDVVAARADSVGPADVLRCRRAMSSPGTTASRRGSGARAAWVDGCSSPASTRPRPRWTRSGPGSSAIRASTCGRGRTKRPASVRVRFFPTDVGILEDEATGRGGVVMGDLLGRAADDPPGCRLRTVCASRSRRPAPSTSAAGSSWSRSATTSPRSGRRDTRRWRLRRRGRRARGVRFAPPPTGHRPRPGHASSGSSSSSSATRNGASADHSRIIRLSYHRPDYVRLARRAYATWAEVEAEAGDRDRHHHRRPRPVARRPGDPAARLLESLDGRGRPVRAARRGRDHAPLAAVAARRRASRDCSRPRVGLADPFEGNAAHRRLATERGATLRDRDAVTRDPRRRRRGRGRRRATATYEAGAVVLATDAWTNELLAVVRPAPAADDHQGAGHVFRGPPTRRRSRRTGSRSGSGWTTRRFYGFPTYGEAGPKAAQDVRRRSPRPPSANVRARSGDALDRVRAFLAAHLPGALGPEIYTKTCLYTLTPDRDFVVDRLPDAPGRRSSGSGPPMGSSTPRCIGSDPRRARARRATPSAAELGGVPHRPADPARGRTRRRRCMV